MYIRCCQKLSTVLVSTKYAGMVIYSLQAGFVFVNFVNKNKP